MAFRTMELPFNAPKVSKQTKCPFRKGDVVFLGDTGPCIVKKVIGPLGPPSNLPFWSFQIEVVRPGTKASMLVDDMVPTANTELMMPHPMSTGQNQRTLRRISTVEYRERFMPMISCDFVPAEGKKKGNGG